MYKDITGKNIEISDESGAEFHTGDMDGMKETIMRHLRKIGDICCKEMVGGWWEKRPISTSAGIIMMEIYHEDLREAYCNAVDFLVDVLYPQSDAQFKEYIDSNEAIDKTFTDINDKLRQKRKTFREINVMFDRSLFWGNAAVYNE